MDSLLGVEMTTGTGTGTGTGAPPSNLWSEPDSNIWPASNSSHDLFHILQNNNDMPVLETRSCIESFPQNKLTIKDEIPLNLPFNTPSFVFQHSPEILPTPINKTLGRSNTNPGGRAKRKKDHAHVTLHNFTSKQSSKESEENKCKRFRSSKYPVVGSESLELDDSKRSEAELPSKVVKKEPKFDSCKDYIHVRARRGQATDSHSLAERVRREKIRERMKRLHELVPGCNKVTGKAQMLDEIINYVQSMQSQVEFLSLKLTSVLSLCSVGLEIDSSRHEEQFQQILPLERTLTAYERDQAESQMPAVSKLY